MGRKFQLKFLLLWLVMTLIMSKSYAQQKIDITGMWRYNTFEQCEVIKPLKHFSNYSLSAPKLHLLNIDSTFYYNSIKIGPDYIDHPLMSLFGEKPIKYKINGNTITLTDGDEKYIYNFSYGPDYFCIDQFCLTRQKDVDFPCEVYGLYMRNLSIDEISYTIEIRDYDFSDPRYFNGLTGKKAIVGYQIGLNEYEYDTLSIGQDTLDYVFELAKRIPYTQWDRIYDSGGSCGVSPISFDIRESNGGHQLITQTSYGFSPFAVNAFKTHFLKAIRRHVDWKRIDQE